MSVVDRALHESIGVGSVLPIDPGLDVEERDNKNKQSESNERREHNA